MGGNRSFQATSIARSATNGRVPLLGPCAAYSSYTMSLIGCRILVLEDEPLLAFDYADELTDRGATPSVVHTVREALNAVSEDMPDLAVLDVNLGHKFCWPVAEMLTGRGVPFYLVSGCVMKGRIPVGIEPEDCLEKPVGAHDLADRLTGLARRLMK